MRKSPRGAPGDAAGELVVSTRAPFSPFRVSTSSEAAAEFQRVASSNQAQAVFIAPLLRKIVSCATAAVAKREEIVHINAGDGCGRRHGIVPEAEITGGNGRALSLNSRSKLALHVSASLIDRGRIEYLRVRYRYVRGTRLTVLKKPGKRGRRYIVSRESTARGLRGGYSR